MTSIGELPDDPKYTIKTVSTQTGIRPVTLRAWERRYDILSPHRAENHYRLYSERDIALLRWVKARLESGMTISSVAGELERLIEDGIWPEILPGPPLLRPEKLALPPAEYSRQLYDALVRHDEARAAEIFQEVNTLFDVPSVFTQILNPTLVEIGEAWYTGRIRITTEHFVSAFLRGRLLALLQAYSPRRGAPFLMVGCAPTEQHEIGSLMLAVLLRAEGFRVEYLGPDIPLEDLIEYASLEHPDMIILSASMLDTAESLKKMPMLMQKLRPLPLFAYGGGAFVMKPELKDEVAGEYLGNTLTEAVETALALLPLDGSKPLRPKKAR